MGSVETDRRKNKVQTRLDLEKRSLSDPNLQKNVRSGLGPAIIKREFPGFRLVRPGEGLRRVDNDFYTGRV